MQKTHPETIKNKTRNSFITFLNLAVLVGSWSLGRLYPLPVLILVVVFFSVIIGIKINEYNLQKNNGNDVEKLKKEIEGYAVWIVIVILGLGIQVWSVGGFQPKNINSSPQTPAELAIQGAESVKSSTKLPYEVDQVTTLTDITSLGNAIQYHYTLHDADTSRISDTTLKRSGQPTVCANTSTKQLLDYGVDLQYLYVVKETGAQYSFTLTKSDC